MATRIPSAAREDGRSGAGVSNPAYAALLALSGLFALGAASTLIPSAAAWAAEKSKYVDAASSATVPTK